jgi:hypothetical protein
MSLLKKLLKDSNNKTQIELYILLSKYGKVDMNNIKMPVDRDWDNVIKYHGFDQWVRIHDDFTCSFNYLEEPHKGVLERLISGDISKEMESIGWYFAGEIELNSRDKEIIDESMFYRKDKFFSNIISKKHKESKKKLLKLNKDLEDMKIVYDNLKDNKFIKIYNKIVNYEKSEIVYNSKKQIGYITNDFNKTEQEIEFYRKIIESFGTTESNLELILE